LRPKGSGKTPGSGRKAGTPNKATADIKALAQAVAPQAFAEAVRLATGAETETARLRAIEIILDRAYGKAHTTADITIKRDVRQPTFSAPSLLLELLARKRMSPNGFIEERVAWWDSSDFARQ
jgi:hypothetical protein